MMTCRHAKCKWQGRLVWSTHIRCMHPLVSESLYRVARVFLLEPGNYHHAIRGLMRQMGVTVNEAGVRNGWCNWPFDFDPVWLDSCKMFEPAEEGDKD